MEKTRFQEKQLKLFNTVSIMLLVFTCITLLDAVLNFLESYRNVSTNSMLVLDYIKFDWFLNVKQYLIKIFSSIRIVGTIMNVLFAITQNLITFVILGIATIIQLKGHRKLRVAFTIGLNILLVLELIAICIVKEGIYINNIRNLFEISTVVGVLSVAKKFIGSMQYLLEAITCILFTVQGLKIGGNNKNGEQQVKENR